METKLSDLIIPKFFEVYKSITEHRGTHYWFMGGRGSTKSSFISIVIILELMRNSKMNAIIFRKIARTIEKSVFNQMLWAIDKLGVNEYFSLKHMPYEITYKPTEQKILFYGLDDPLKIKSIKTAKGYFGAIWFEEADEFGGMFEIRNVLQSVMRGGEIFSVFYSYNPPNQMSNWVNEEAEFERDDKVIVKNTYLDIPENIRTQWLGEQFLIEAEHLKKQNELAYKHEYMGEITGTGGAIFTNVKKSAMTDETIRKFDNLRQGIDWGYVNDAAAWVRLHYDKTRRSVYIFDEIYGLAMSNRTLADKIKNKLTANELALIKNTADSAEPKSVDELKGYGLLMQAADKGQGSVEHGIKWLQDLENIYIDDARCPHAFREFMFYELERDKNGELKREPPDKDNHTIDAVRYALEKDMKRKSYI
jgi:PBSX family phage terminase large subunit